MTEKKCNYYLPTRTTPAAEPLTVKPNFCDHKLQKMLVKLMTGNSETSSINCNHLQNNSQCPNFAEETENSRMFKLLIEKI